LLLFSLAVANAQVYRPYDNGPRYDNGNRYYDRDDYRYNRGSVVDRVRSDIDRAELDSAAYGGDRYRLDRVRQELTEFQNTRSRRELNESIVALQMVVSQNRLSYRDRDVLGEDLNRLRNLRARAFYGSYESR